jgi:hypothetical protein
VHQIGDTGGPMPPALRAAMQADQLQPDRGPPDYALREASATGQWLAHNATHGLRVSFSKQTVDVAPLDDANAPPLLSLRLVEWGRAGQLEAPQPARIVASGARIDYQRGPLVEWYVNDARGLEQSFSIETPPAAGDASAPIELRIALGGQLESRLLPGNAGLSLSDEQDVSRLSYAQLSARDADRRPLAAWLGLSDDAVSVFVDDHGALRRLHRHGPVPTA